MYCPIMSLPCSRTLHSRLDVDVECIRGEHGLLNLQVSDHLEVGQRPCMPSLVPVWVKLSRMRIVGENLRRVILIIKH